MIWYFGTDPEMVVPNILAEQTTYHSVITCDGLTLKIYINKLADLSRLELTPGIKFLKPVVPINVTSHNLSSFKALFYALVFVPLGDILALITLIVKGKTNSTLLLFYSGGSLPPSLILEWILANGGQRGVQLCNLVLSVGILVSTLFIFRVLINPRMVTSQRCNHKFSLNNINTQH